MIWIIFLIILVALGSIGTFIVLMALRAKKIVRKRAYKMLQQEHVDKKEAQKLIGQLSALGMGRDAEAAELVRQLMAKTGGPVVNMAGQ